MSFLSMVCLFIDMNLLNDVSIYLLVSVIRVFLSSYEL